MSSEELVTLEKVRALADAGNWLEVLPLVEEHAARTRECYGERSIAYARSLHNVAGAQEQLHQFDAASETRRREIEILGTAGANELLARSVIELADLYERLGRSGDAEAVRADLGQRAKARGLNDLGLAEYREGRYAEAARHLGEAIALWRDLGNSQVDLAISLDNLGIVRHDAGDYAGAENLHLEAIGLFRLYGRWRDYATALHNVGSLYLALGRPECESFLEEALAIKRRLFPHGSYELAATLADLGALRFEQSRNDEAEDLLHEAVEMYAASGFASEHPDVLKASVSLQIVRAARGSVANALPLQLAALAQARNALPPEHPDLITPLLAVAASLVTLQRYDEAEPLVLEAVGLARHVLGDAHIATAQALFTLANLYLTMERQNDALAPLLEAARIDDRVMSKIAGIGIERLRMMYSRAIHVHTSSLLATVATHFAAEPVAVRAAYDSVLRRKGLVAEIASVRRERVLAERFPELADELSELSSLRRQIAQRSLRGPGRMGMEAAERHKRQLDELAHRRDELEAEILRVLPEDALALEFDCVDSAAVGRALPEDTALVEFVRYQMASSEADSQADGIQARYVAFVVLGGHGGDVRMIDLGDADPIARLVVKFREAIASAKESRHETRGPQESDERTSGESLRSTVIDPVIPELRERRRMILAPDADLYFVPFEVIPAAGNGRLIDSYRLSYVDTGRDVLRFGRDRSRVGGAPAVVADPDFELGDLPISDAPEPAIQFESLPGTQSEGEAVAKRVGALPLLGPDALERTVRNLQAPRILHLATHGFFRPNPRWNTERPLTVSVRLITIGGAAAPQAPDHRLWENLDDPLVRCGFALAGANVALSGGDTPPDAEDGLLNGQDILAMNLLGTQLVVASACDTGLGELQSGEGVLGLRRAFVHAGAGTLIMSLWKVRDDATRRLMESLYAHLANGKACSDALRCAQIELAVDCPPSDWGAFVCYGDPSPLSFEFGT